MSAVAIAIAMLGGAGTAHAGFRVAPSMLDLELRPGGSAVGTFDVHLEGERGARLTVVPEDVVQLPDGGFAYRTPTGAPEPPRAG